MNVLFDCLDWYPVVLSKLFIKLKNDGLIEQIFSVYHTQKFHDEMLEFLRTLNLVLNKLSKTIKEPLIHLQIVHWVYEWKQTFMKIILKIKLIINSWTIQYSEINHINNQTHSWRIQRLTINFKLSLLNPEFIKQLRIRKQIKHRWIQLHYLILMINELNWC